MLVFHLRPCMYMKSSKSDLRSHIYYMHMSIYAYDIDLNYIYIIVALS